MVNGSKHLLNEKLAAEAFSNQSAVFDKIYSNDTIIQYKRKRVRDHVGKFLKSRSYILELNAGTGEDSIYFAQQGHNVHATDISEGMLQQLAEKVDQNALSKKISVEQCSFTALDSLKNRGPYDLIFSNFAGLNCTGELDKVLLSFDKLLKTGGIVSLVILPPFCFWESLLFFKGHFKTAFRRTTNKKGTKAHVEGVYFTCWYYKPSFIRNVLKDKFDILGIEGLCTIVPPSYIEHFAERHPRLFHFFKKWEDKLKNKWPWRNIGDYYIISLRKK